MIAYEIHNTLVEYMTETNTKCSFKVREIENGLYAIELYTCNPGVLIGKSGELVHKYTKVLKEREISISIILRLMKQMDLYIQECLKLQKNSGKKN